MSEYKVYIYYLKDPFTEQVRYVGKTFEPKSRFSSHLAGKGNKNKSNWIKSLKVQNSIPLMEIVEECTNENCAEREIFHISNARENNYPIFNVAKGGGSKTLLKKRKVIISAAIQKETVLAVMDIAKKEKRSFSQMINMLLLEAIEVRKAKTKKN